jgi:hypothetical protein
VKFGDFQDMLCPPAARHWADDVAVVFDSLDDENGINTLWLRRLDWREYDNLAALDFPLNTVLVAVEVEL